MAHVKNSHRSKRKYNDKRQSRTARNKASKKAAAERRAENLILRTVELEGQRVRYGTHVGRPLIGRVLAILRHGDEGYPCQDPSGSYLVIEDRVRGITTTRARRRVKPV